MIAIETIRQGERAAVWDAKGRVRFVDGPRRLFLFRQTVEHLPRHSAEADQYLVIRYEDGHAEHVRGPADVWYDPVLHREVRVEQAMPIDAHEAVVVYRREQNDVEAAGSGGEAPGGGGVSRRVERGPALFVPTEHEWLHEFRWHGASAKDPTKKVPRGLVFHKLRVIPDQMYFDVDDVRTADDALLTIKLMIFFELTQVERMLDQTHDPVADFINAVSADVIDFAAGLSFEKFKQQTELLNELETYPNLTVRAERIGYRINKVVYRGYAASGKLQSMHDNAIETRTRLKLEGETEEQAQALADLKQQREAGRAETQRQQQAREAEHRRELAAAEHEQKLRQRRAQRDQAAEVKRMFNEIELDHQRAMDEERAAALGAMREMQVDLTRYLVAQYQHPDRLIRIDSSGGGGPGNGQQLHVHDQ
jgi:hypothetical protein